MRSMQVISIRCDRIAKTLRCSPQDLNVGLESESLNFLESRGRIFINKVETIKMGDAVVAASDNGGLNEQTL